MKNLVVFIFFAVIFSSLTGCSKSSNQSANIANTATAPQDNSVPEAAEKKDFPAVSPEIMQAKLTAPDGTEFKLEDYKGKVVLVNLWAIWCGPCKAEMPSLIELQNQFKDKNFEIIGLNVGDENAEKESPENIKSFAEKMNLNYKLAQADDKIYNEFLKTSKFGGIPQSFLIDREGHLNGVFVGGGSSTIVKLKNNVAKLVNAN